MSLLYFLPFILHLGNPDTPIVSLVQVEGKPLNSATHTVIDASAWGANYSISNYSGVLAGSQYVPVVLGGTMAKFESFTPNIATVDSQGKLSYVSNGVARVRVVVSKDQEQYGYVLSAVMKETVSPSTNFTHKAFAPNSLASNMTWSVSNAVQLRSFSDTYSKAFTFRDGPNSNFTRNAQCILHGKTGFSAVSPGRTDNLVWYQGTAVAISPLHLYCATHVAISPGSGISFVSDSGEIQTRHVIDRTAVGDDITIALLDAPLTEAIPPIKVLQADWITAKLPNILVTNWLPNLIFESNRLPVFGMTQEDRVFIFDLFQGIDPVVCNVTSSSRYPSWACSLRGGDSGKPLMALIGNELCLIMGWTYINGGTHLSSRISQVNTAMQSLSTANGKTVYTLTVKDLSAFSTITN